MGNESSKQPGSPAGHKGTGSNVSGVMMPTGGGRKSSNGEPDEYCWATGYWTVMHDSGSSDAAAPPFTVYKSNPCEDFQGETIVQRLGNRLKLYRHPQIIKYKSGFPAGGRSHLHTEYSYPLSQEPANKWSPHFVCQGILDVLIALIFLHEKVGVSHNNISLSSVFYCPLEGRWKLGGLQWVEHYTSIKSNYLKAIRPHLEESFMPPEDTSKFTTPIPSNMQARDVYGLGCLIEELLKERHDGETVPLSGQVDFLNFARNSMKNRDPESRPALSDIKHHPYFQQQHIKILDFLENIPLKSEPEKSSFFRELTPALFKIPESVIGDLLVPALLSRLVLLDATARTYFLPNMLQPEWDNKGRRLEFGEDREINPICGSTLFKAKVAQHLGKIFHVQDYTVRMVLLEHFPSFVNALDKSDLETGVLPQILLGLRDTHEDLVALSLEALAHLVPILGATIVVGKERQNLFKDGTPGRICVDGQLKPSPQASPSSKGAKPKHLQQQNLPSIPAFTRPSPIGAEVETALNTHRLATNTINEHEDLSSDHNIAAGTLSDDQGWDDWDTDHGGAESLAGDGIDDQEDAKDVIDLSRQPHMIHGQLQLEQNLSDFKKALNEATNRELDKILSKAHVKIEPKSKAPIPDPEPDFFADMEPVIKTNVIQLDEAFEPELKKSGSPSHEKLKKKELFENSHAKENPKTSITKSLIEPKLPEVQGKEGAEISKDELKNVEKDVDDKSGSSPVITSSRLGVASVGAHDEDILEADEDGGGGWGDEDVIFDDPTSGTEDLALED